MKRRRKSKSPTGSSTIAVAYLRVSTEDQKLGLDAQRGDIERWAERTKTTVAAWFLDEDVSGSTGLEDRKNLQEAFVAIRQHGAGVLIVAKRDRIARDVAITAIIERELLYLGATLVSAAGEGNGTSPSDLLQRRIIDAFAEHERLIIQMRTRAALQVKIDKGERTGSLRFGWALGEDGKMMIPNYRERNIISLVKQLRGGGMTFRAIVQELDYLGHRSRTGEKFALTQVFNMMKMEF